jgi:alpha-glucoside transport system substrate-binding protein
MYKKFGYLLMVLIILGFVSAACGGGSEPQQTTAEEQPASAAAVEAPAAVEEKVAKEQETTADTAATTTSYYDRAMAGEFAGTVVTILGGFSSDDETKFLASIADFEEKTGIDIQYFPSTTFDSTISVRVDADDKPDIADFAQPGLLARFVEEGHIIDVRTFLSDEYLQGQYDQSWLDMVTMESPDGPIQAGVWQRFNGKSLVWYPKDDFEAAGYQIPQTWDEMIALSDQIVADGDTPWCIGIASGAATGWPATDWVEDILLRTTSLENYDKWTKGELLFSSPEVKRAFELMSQIMLNDDYVFGGRSGVVNTDFGNSPVSMFEEPPKCWLHRQGNFITTFFPEGVEAGQDYDFFYFPPIDEASGRPFLVGGDIMAMLQDRDEVRAVMEFFTRGESIKEWLAAGGALSPHKDVQLDWYGTTTERGIAEIVAQSTSFRYDGSDLMPGEVGTGSFWKGITDYLTGTIDLDTALQEIDASWPK